MRIAVALLAAAYWRTAVDKSDEAFAAWEAVDAICRLPGIGSRIVVAMARHADTEDKCAQLGAHPLEDLVDRGDPEDLAVIDAALPNTPELARAIRSVNEPDEPTLVAWLRARQ